jgi:putative DNA primase/helicase
MVVYTPMAADDELYLAVRDFLDDGGLEKWLHYLLTYPLEDFGRHTKPPLTKDKQRLIQANWRAPARFAHEWLEGYLDLPLVPCSGDQAYRAFQRWCYLAGEKFPPNRDTFTEEVNRWAQENSGKDDSGRRLPPLMECKVVQHKDAVGHRRAIRTWLPRGTGPVNGVTLGEWAFESAEQFQAALSAFCGSRMSEEASQ